MKTDILYSEMIFILHGLKALCEANRYYELLIEHREIARS